MSEKTATKDGQAGRTQESRGVTALDTGGVQPAELLIGEGFAPAVRAADLPAIDGDTMSGYLPLTMVAGNETADLVVHADSVRVVCGLKPNEAARNAGGARAKIVVDIGGGAVDRYLIREEATEVFATLEAYRRQETVERRAVSALAGRAG